MEMEEEEASQEVEDEASQEEKDEAKRLELRQGYRKLMDTIAKNEDSLLSQDNTDLLDCLKEGAQLFSQVNAPQELGMDANVVKNLSRICKKQVHQMSANIHQFRYEDYVMKLRQGMNVKNRLDMKKWVMLGQQAKVMFRRSPYLPSYIYGALSTIPPEPKVEKTREKKARQATKVSDLKETQTVTLEEAETSDNITDKIVSNVYKVLVQKFKENERKPINFFKFVLHPSSFGASIENMFHVSFLIKENKVAVRICKETKMPLIEPLATKKKEKESTEELGKFQVVMNISFQEWKDLVTGLEIKTPMLEC